MASGPQVTSGTFSGGGLVSANTDAIRSFLMSSGRDERQHSGEIRELDSALSSKNESEELKERLKTLAEHAERREYQELVKDIAPKKQIKEPFSAYKDQIGLGLHVVLTMFTGYLVGFYSLRALFDHSIIMNAAGGILGLVCGMLLETVLFIIRGSSQDLASTSKSKKHQ